MGYESSLEGNQMELLHILWLLFLLLAWMVGSLLTKKATARLSDSKLKRWACKFFHPTSNAAIILCIITIRFYVSFPQLQLYHKRHSIFQLHFPSFSMLVSQTIHHFLDHLHVLYFPSFSMDFWANFDGYTQQDLYQLWDTFLGVVRVIPDSAPPRSGKPAVTWGVLGQDFDGFWSDISKVGPETSYIQIGFCNFSIKDYCINPSETYL